MAVIISNIDLPKSCSDCPICHCKGKDKPWNYCCFATMDDVNIEEWDNDRYITCPLKSTEDLKQELFNYLFDNSDIEIGLAEIDGLEAIIDKYCGEENKDDKT